MKLFETLYNYTNDDLKRFLKLLNGPSKLTRKDQLVVFLIDELLTPAKLRSHWQRLDALSQKAVTAAYHNEGVFLADAFIAQYGALPERPKTMWTWLGEPILFDLFVWRNQIPEDMLPLLADLVPPPERFQVTGLVETPQTAASFDEPQPLFHADTEAAGLHDLSVYLRMLDQGQIDISNTSSHKLTPASAQKLYDNLLNGDFFPSADKTKFEETIRPFGLHVFALDAGLASSARNRRVTDRGREFLHTQNPEILLEALETWNEQGSFDELTRINAIRGQKAKGIRLTKPGKRRAAIVEALSWCPTGVWIPIEEFYRALVIWHFDFELEEGVGPYGEKKLYIGYGREAADYAWADTQSQWRLTKGLYINAVLWEYLGSIGALDLLYLHPEDAAFPAEAYYYDAEYYSRYDGLKYFRINKLGAYLFGQASEYEVDQQADAPLFTINADLHVTLCDPAALTPNLHSQLCQSAQDLGNGRYRLDTQLLLTALEEGSEFAALTDFLAERNAGPLPAEVSAWLDQVKTNSRAFTRGAQAVFIKVRSAELAQQVLADPTIGKYCQAVDAKTLVVTTNREKTVANRLKELGYGLAK